MRGISLPLSFLTCSCIFRYKMFSSFPDTVDMLTFWLLQAPFLTIFFLAQTDFRQGQNIICLFHSSPCSTSTCMSRAFISDVSQINQNHLFDSNILGSKYCFSVDKSLSKLKKRRASYSYRPN